jgi:hypothetical protein
MRPLRIKARQDSDMREVKGKFIQSISVTILQETKMKIMNEAKEIFQKKELAKLDVANDITYRVLDKMPENLIKETVSKILKERMMQELERVKTAEEVFISVLTGRIYEEASLELV